MLAVHLIGKSCFSLHSSRTSCRYSTHITKSFPCVDKISARHEKLAGKASVLTSDSSAPSSTSQLITGPEPNYSKASGGHLLFRHQEDFRCMHGGVLHGFELAYETWGSLNDQRDNVVLVHTGLSASSHAKSHDKNTNLGWWEQFIGDGKAIDTSKFFVICTNMLGSCFGSTGPASINPTTNLPYATHFPIVSIEDIVQSQQLLVSALNVKIHASVGASMGGQASLVYAATSDVRKCVSISAALSSSPTSIANRFLQRQMIMGDERWRRGEYYKAFGGDGVGPHVGVKLARMAAMIGYRSGPEWTERFGRKRIRQGADPEFCADFAIEAYLDHQGEKFCQMYDANSLLYLSKAMDLFDFEASMHPWPKCHTLVLGIQSDLLFPVHQQRELASLLRSHGNQSVTYYELDSIYGHDTFLIDVVNIGAAIKGHLEGS